MVWSVLAKNNWTSTLYTTHYNTDNVPQYLVKDTQIVCVISNALGGLLRIGDFQTVLHSEVLDCFPQHRVLLAGGGP